MLTRAQGDEDGFTLVELMVVMAIGLVIMGAVLATTITLVRASQYSIDETYTQDVNRVGMERITRFVRQATYPQGGSASNSHLFEKAEGDEVIHFADIDDDDVVERIRFKLVDGEVLQSIMECDDVSTCTYAPLASAVTGVAVDEVRNNDLDTGVCPGFAADEPVFEYFERAADGSLSALTDPVSPALYGRIAAVRITLVVDITEGADAACQELSSLIHLRNWRG